MMKKAITQRNGGNSFGDIVSGSLLRNLKIATPLINLDAFPQNPYYSDSLIRMKDFVLWTNPINDSCMIWLLILKKRMIRVGEKVSQSAWIKVLRSALAKESTKKSTKSPVA